MAKTVGMISLGCPKNQVDAEIMLKKLVDAGYILVDEAEKADVVIVNTCAFIEDSKKESIDNIEHKKFAEKIAEEKEKAKEKAREEELSKGKSINIFSAASFPAQENRIIEEKIEAPAQEQEEIIEEEAVEVESKVSSVIEKPNYDYIETLSDSQREKVFKIEKEEKVIEKPKPSKIKIWVMGILLAIFGVWGIGNIITVENVGAQIAEVSTEYSLNLATYLKNLTSLDATNSENMNNLFQTIPEEESPASEVGQQSNWFDRICNFITGLFGG